MAVPKQSFTGEDEEAEETISLCDLPIYSDDSNCDHYSKIDSSDHDDTFFEFFRHDFSASDSVYSRSDSIIFCGKWIPIDSVQNTERRIESEKISARNRQIRTKSHSFDARTRTERGAKSFDSISLPKNPERISRKLEKCELAAERAMMLRSSPTKSKWFLFLFGGAGFPKEVELSDMRTRQRRRIPPAMFRPSEERKVGGGGKRKTVRGLWKVVRALVMGCTSSDRNVAVKASFLPIP